MHSWIERDVREMLDKCLIGENRSWLFKDHPDSSFKNSVNPIVQILASGGQNLMEFLWVGDSKVSIKLLMTKECWKGLKRLKCFQSLTELKGINLCLEKYSFEYGLPFAESRQQCFNRRNVDYVDGIPLDSFEIYIVAHKVRIVGDALEVTQKPTPASFSNQIQKLRIRYDFLPTEISDLVHSYSSNESCKWTGTGICLPQCNSIADRQDTDDAVSQVSSEETSSTMWPKNFGLIPTIKISCDTSAKDENSEASQSLIPSHHASDELNQTFDGCISTTSTSSTPNNRMQSAKKKQHYDEAAAEERKRRKMLLFKPFPYCDRAARYALQFHTTRGDGVSVCKVLHKEKQEICQVDKISIIEGKMNPEMELLCAQSGTPRVKLRSIRRRMGQYGIMETDTLAESKMMTNIVNREDEHKAIVPVRYLHAILAQQSSWRVDPNHPESETAWEEDDTKLASGLHEDDSVTEVEARHSQEFKHTEKQETKHKQKRYIREISSVVEDPMPEQENFETKGQGGLSRPASKSAPLQDVTKTMGWMDDYWEKKRGKRLRTAEG